MEKSVHLLLLKRKTHLRTRTLFQGIFEYITISVYGLRKFGTLIKPSSPVTKPLKFEFHFSKICCRMLQEEKVYYILTL